jgi:hypothetical protein
VFETQQLASVAELVGAITAAVVGEQGAHADAVASEEVQGIAQEGDGGVGLLIGQDLSEGQAGVVVDGDVQSFPSGMFVLAATASVSALRDLLEAGHALDVEMEQIAGSGMFVAHDGRGGMQIAPATEPSAAQNAADGSRTDGGAACDLIAGSMVTAQMNDVLDHRVGEPAWTAMRARRAII